MATNRGGKAPRAVIHKRILETAEAAPDASLEALAADVAGASPDLVERVLAEYGDPGGESPVGPDQPEEPTMSDPASLPTAEALTEKQRETLEAVAAAPEATQAELAEALGISRATVNTRLNAIEGFDWGDREAFVAAVLGAEVVARSPDEPAAETPDATAEAAVDGGQLLSADSAHAVEQLQERVARLEQQFGASVEEAAPALADAELLTKVLRAVMAADDITADEEVAVVEALR